MTREPRPTAATWETSPCTGHFERGGHQPPGIARRFAGLTLLLWLSVVSTALGQEPATRAEADRLRREEKAQEVRPYEPQGFERAMKFAENRAIFLIDREGFYPKLGSLTTGSGFAYGIGFRDRDLFENKGMLDIWTAATTRKYWAAEARLRFPALASKRLLLETWVSRRDYPRENFFGLGPDSNRQDQSDYAIRTGSLWRTRGRQAPLVRPRRRWSRVP